MHPDWNTESEHLQNTVRFITQLLKEKLEEKDYLINEQADINRNMWDDSGAIVDLESISDFMQHIGLLKQNMAWSKRTAKDIVRLDKQRTFPYFGRIDFVADHEQPDTIYIGIHTLTNDETSQILIYDWRAPVCSMFYDYETGPASYKCPAGIIKGEITLKRQYRIEGGKLLLMFDSNLAINDDILQELLAHNTSNKMRNIVSSIQREQNAAIRDDSARLLAIQGAAGSGKTSVALHRASYLLYRHKKHIKSDNLVILSSTDVLGDYISNVLPELGEDEIKGITFKEIVARHLPHGDMRLQSHPQLMEQVLTSHQGYRAKLTQAIRYKSSSLFLSAMDAFFEYAVQNLFPLEDIYFKNQLVMSEKELRQLFFGDFARMHPLARLKRVENRINDKVKPLKKLHQEQKTHDIEDEDISLSHKEARLLSHMNLKAEIQPFYESLARMSSINALMLYKKLFAEDAAWTSCIQTSVLDPRTEAFIRDYTLENLNHGLIGFEDLGPLLYLSLLLGEIEPDMSVKHLMVDEAQDYSALQLLSLQKLYPLAGITILGDISQNISPYASLGNLEQMAVFLSPDDHSFIRLNKSYRSTVEIGAFASHFITAEQGENFGRHGEKPRVVLADDKHGLEATLVKDIKEKLSHGQKTIAIITRSLSDAKAIYPIIKKQDKTLQVPVRLMQEDYEYAIEGVMIIPSYLAKGLEFDSVMVVFTNSDDYSAMDEKGLLYTVFSRALHHLNIYCPENKMPDALTHVAPSCYSLNG